MKIAKTALDAFDQTLYRFWHNAMLRPAPGLDPGRRVFILDRARIQIAFATKHTKERTKVRHPREAQKNRSAETQRRQGAQRVKLLGALGGKKVECASRGPLCLPSCSSWPSW